MLTGIMWLVRFFTVTNWQVLEERTGGVSTATIQYVWSPVYVDSMILRDRSTMNNGTLDERLWVQEDANWNVTALVNISGGIVERYVYDPYGKVTFANASWSTLSGSAYAWLYLHQGGRYDATTTLYNFRARDLSPTLGRWMATDPLGFTGLTNSLYIYLDNAPESHTDPRGTEPDDQRGNSVSITVLKKPSAVEGKCGLFTVFEVEYKVGDFALMSDSGKDTTTRTGWIIQHLTVVCNRSKCDPKKREKVIDKDYYEAWQVINGVVYQGAKQPNGKNTPGLDDFNIGKNTREGTEGECVFKGSVWFEPEYVLKRPPWAYPGDAGHEPAARSLPSLTGQKPFGWWDDAKGKPHTLTLAWCCCGKGKDFSTVKEFTPEK